ncbi:helix-turn-helix transcriptional regulator [Roseomonas genomospecies 6]|uniref:XRE family transcriptional regulator n=1 Tax=Roseomonas genomospecies 6 TaxID=214106 RepID=A0A9W7TZ33_9PROT|nr:helix-turn-helix transcriptional regulator [Roseomonas genomospecies 6]KAA0682270.1 XRE family transcriptional regulator [Roseomonas genomospecies 6]
MRPSIYNERQRRLRELLREARQEKGLKQVQVAEALGLPQSTISKYESGERRLDVIEFIDLCEVLGVDPRHIVGRLLTKVPG